MVGIWWANIHLIHLYGVLHQAAHKGAHVGLSCVDRFSPEDAQVVYRAWAMISHVQAAKQHNPAPPRPVWSDTTVWA
jgi:hypothetical protein